MKKNSFVERESVTSDLVTAIINNGKDLIDRQRAEVIHAKKNQRVKFKIAMASGKFKRLAYDVYEQIGGDDLGKIWYLTTDADSNEQWLVKDSDDNRELARSLISASLQKEGYGEGDQGQSEATEDDIKTKPTLYKHDKGPTIKDATSYGDSNFNDWEQRLSEDEIREDEADAKSLEQSGKYDTYRMNQIDNLPQSESPANLKITQDGAETKWMSITPAELAHIKSILIKKNSSLNVRAFDESYEDFIDKQMLEDAWDRKTQRERGIDDEEDASLMPRFRMKHKDPSHKCILEASDNVVPTTSPNSFQTVDDDMEPMEWVTESLDADKQSDEEKEDVENKKNYEELENEAKESVESEFGIDMLEAEMNDVEDEAIDVKRLLLQVVEKILDKEESDIQQENTDIKTDKLDGEVGGKPSDDEDSSLEVF